MRSPLRRLGSLAVGLTVACAGAPKHDSAVDAQAIRAIDARWNEYIAARNDSAIGAIYASTAVLMPDRMPAITGTEAIRGFWAVLWTMNANLVLTVDDVLVDGDLAVDRGHYTMTGSMPDGSPVNDAGKYLVAWQRVGGEWKAVNDIWNSDSSPPAAPAPR